MLQYDENDVDMDFKMMKYIANVFRAVNEFDDASMHIILGVGIIEKTVERLTNKEQSIILKHAINKLIDSAIRGEM